VNYERNKKDARFWKHSVYITLIGWNMQTTSS